MRSRVMAFWVLLCLCGHFVASFAEAQGKPAALPKPATQAKPTATTPSPENQAREAFERGRAHYDSGDFAQAATAFEQAYQLSGREGLLYNLYLSYRDANQQENAAEALRQYLAKVEVIENRAQLEARLKALDAGIAQRKADEASEAAERERAAQQHAEQEKALAAQKAAQDAQKAAASPQKWWLAPVVVMGAGGALMVGSLATGLMATTKANDLEKECPTRTNCDPALKSEADSGKTLALVTDILLFGGLATAAVGGVLLLLKKPKKQAAAPDSPRASFACTRVGCGGHVSLRF